MEEQGRKPLEITPDLYDRLQAFLPILEAVLGENVHHDLLAGVVVIRGLDSMLRDVLRGPPDEDPVLKSYLEMGRENPHYVYDFVARTWQARQAPGLAEWWKQILDQGSLGDIKLIPPGT